MRKRDVKKIAKDSKEGESSKKSNKISELNPASTLNKTLPKGKQGVKDEQHLKNIKEINSIPISNLPVGSNTEPTTDQKEIHFKVSKDKPVKRSLSKKEANIKTECKYLYRTIRYNL